MTAAAASGSSHATGFSPRRCSVAIPAPRPGAKSTVRATVAGTSLMAATLFSSAMGLVATSTAATSTAAPPAIASANPNAHMMSTANINGATRNAASSPPTCMAAAMSMG